MYNRVGIWQTASFAEPLEIELGVAREEQPDPSPGARYLSVPLDAIPTDIPLPCALYVRISEKYVLFRKAGDLLTLARAQALQVPSNGVIFVSLQEWARLLNSLESLFIAGQQSVLATDGLAQGLRIRNLLVAYAREIDQSKVFAQPLLKRIEDLSGLLASLLKASTDLSAQLLRRYQDPSLYHVNHAVNVAIYSLAIANKQNMDLAQMKALSFAALVHNVGNIRVPAEVLFKPGELTLDEKKLVDSHILHGASLLQSMSAPKEVVVTAMQHHDRYDGLGAPDSRPSGSGIHIFARICSIADVFDAITSFRPYHSEPLSPEAAVKRMADMTGKFDPGILPTVGGADARR